MTSDTHSLAQSRCLSVQSSKGNPSSHKLLLGCVAAAALALGLMRYEFKPVLTVGNSMLPTVRPGSFVIVSKRAYRRSPPQRGDIVVARLGREWVLKRIVGLPGEEIEVRSGCIYIDGRRVAEHHLIQRGRVDIAAGHLSSENFALLGDNRGLPASVLVYGVVQRSEILGKVIFQFDGWRAHRVRSTRGLGQCFDTRRREVTRLISSNWEFVPRRIRVSVATGYGRWGKKALASNPLLPVRQEAHCKITRIYVT